MANTQKTTKFFYPPRPGSGAATFSDNIVGLQTVEGGGLTQGNFEFTTSVVEKVNRTFNVGAFSEPINLEGLDINDVNESRRILATQFRVYPNYDVSQCNLKIAFWLDNFNYFDFSKVLIKFHNLPTRDSIKIRAI